MSDPVPTSPQLNEVVPPTPKWTYWIFAGVFFLAIGAGGIEHHWPVPAIAAAFGAIGGIVLAFLARYIADFFPSHNPIDEVQNIAAGVKVAGVILLVAAIVAGLILKSVGVTLASAAVATVISAATILINLKYDRP